jgi:glutamyl-tRNA(Gln) amidotransferase subunit E
MLDPKKIDFKKLGFHAGLEVHHQIRSGRKLFCHCSPILEKDPTNMDYSFYRYFRPVLGEMGDFDPGMLVEFEKGYKAIYLACEQNTCTYEMDETPPFHPDLEAIRKGYELAVYFNCSALAEELVVCRKQYLDGSITTGFQRTFITGRDGWVPVGNRKVRISNVHIEEDAARRVDWFDTSSRNVYFNLDRLGVPLTEVITDYRDVENPEELVELAKQIGRVLRISRIGRRGIGSVRQDVNVSIDGGNRVEIKGVQNLAAFDLFSRHEVVRQNALIEISKKMKSRGLTRNDFEHLYIDVSHLFQLEGDTRALVTVFPRMNGMFGIEVQPNKDFGEEIFEKSMLITGIPREDHFHSDETKADAIRKHSAHASRLSIDRAKYRKICSAVKSRPRDAFILVVGPEKRAMHALKKIVERVKIALDGVPQETRRLLPNGNSEFLRVIHGKERIYPDTDTPPIVISDEIIAECRQKVGKRPWEISRELNERYGFSQHQVDLLIRDEKIERFYHYTDSLHLKGQIAYRLLIELPRRYRRIGIQVKDQAINKFAAELAKGHMTLSQIERGAKTLSGKTNFNLRSLSKTFHSRKVDDQELERLVMEQLELFDINRIKSDEDYREIVVPKVVGNVMKLTGGSVEGKQVLNKTQTLLGVDRND